MNAWDMLASKLSALPEFAVVGGVAGQACKIEFNRLYKERKVFNASAPFRSGDDSEEYTDFVRVCCVLCDACENMRKHNCVPVCSIAN